MTKHTVTMKHRSGDYAEINPDGSYKIFNDHGTQKETGSGLKEERKTPALVQSMEFLIDKGFYTFTMNGKSILLNK